MFRKMGRAAESMGLKDAVGTIVKPADYDKVEADDYLFDDESIFVLIKSKSDEYCFSNRALVHVDGERTVGASKRRRLRRFPYHVFKLSQVEMETAGKVDRDIEIKFVLTHQDTGNEISYSIDIDKEQMSELKKLYKALLTLSERQRIDSYKLSFSNKALEYAAQSVRLANPGSFAEIQEKSFQLQLEAFEKFRVADFAYVFTEFGLSASTPK